jgi:hypothetical protein
MNVHDFADITLQRVTFAAASRRVADIPLRRWLSSTSVDAVDVRRRNVSGWYRPRARSPKRMHARRSCSSFAPSAHRSRAGD